MSSPSKGKTLSDAAYAPEVGRRVAQYLKQAYPDARAKRIAEDFQVHEATAKGWLSGNPPQNEHLFRMLARWKKSFAAFVLQPVGDWTVEWMVEAELEAIRRKQEQLEAEYERLRGRS